MGGVDLNAGEPRLLGDAGGGDEAAHNVTDLLAAELAGRLEELSVAAGIRHLAGGDRATVDRARRLPAGVVDLHPQLGAVGGSRLRPVPQHLQVGLVLDDDIARLPQVTGVDRDVAGHEDPGTAGGPAPVEIHDVLRGSQVRGSQGLVHGRLEEAVLHSHPAGQGERFGEDGACGGHRRPFVEASKYFDLLA